MSRDVNLDLAALHKLPTDERLASILDHIIAQKAVWGLTGKDGWVLVSASEDTCLPIWPSKELANEWGETTSPTAEPREISLVEWVDVWLPGMEKNGTSVLVCPTSGKAESTVLSAKQLMLYMGED